MDCIEARHLRHLYLDGELDRAVMPAMETHLRGCAACAVLHEHELALRIALRLRLPRYRAPALLRARLRREIARRERRRFDELRLLGVGWNPLAIAASIMLAIVASSALTTSYLRGADEEPLAQQVVASHIRSLMVDHLTDVASSDQHMVKPWFNGKLDLSPPVVDLVAAGFPLVGGRLDYIGKHAVAALVYRRQQHVINVLVWPEESGKSDAADFAQQGYNVIHFERGGMSFWVVSDLNPAELHDFVAKLTAAVPDEAAGAAASELMRERPLPL